MKPHKSYLAILFAFLVAMITSYSRIVEGSQYPWAAYLAAKKSNGEWKYCSATIVNKKWLMSAADCFTDELSDPSKWIVEMGVKKITIQNGVLQCGQSSANDSYTTTTTIPITTTTVEIPIQTTTQKIKKYLESSTTTMTMTTTTSGQSATTTRESITTTESPSTTTTHETTTIREKTTPITPNSNQNKDSNKGWDNWGYMKWDNSWDNDNWDSNWGTWSKVKPPKWENTWSNDDWHKSSWNIWKRSVSRKSIFDDNTPGEMAVQQIGRSVQTNSNDNLQCRKIRLIKIHPKYNSTTSQFNLAMLKLSKPAELTKSPNIKKVLPRFSGRSAGWPVSGQQCHIAGLCHHQQIPSSNMSTATIEIKSEHSCNAELYSKMNNKTEYCGKFKDTHKDCLDNNGAGLICQKMHRLYLAGIFSIAKGKTNNNTLLFTRVSAYRDWIIQVSTNN